MASTIDSNITGLRIAEEVFGTIGILPGTPDWDPYEPNTYSDFGASLTLLARNPIVDTRQQKKGVITDLDVSGGFVTDYTQDNMIALLEGFFMADWIEKPVTKSRNAAQLPITSTTTSTYVASGAGLDTAGFKVGHLILAEGFADAANNGLKTINTVTATVITVDETLVVDAAPAANAQLTAVGIQFGTGELDVTAPGGVLPELTRASGTIDMSAMGVAAGDFIWIGGDGAADIFDTAVNNGAARVKTVAAASWILDKSDGTMTDEAGADETIQLFFGHRINNAAVSGDFKRRTFQLERTLGDDGGGTQSEYLIGAVPNQMTLTIPQADKITADLTFVGIDHEQRTGATGVKSGNRGTLIDTDAFNTSSDFSRLKVNVVDPIESNPTALFAFLTELTIVLSNNVDPNKAVAVLGAFEVNTGQLEVSGSATAYFSTTAAITAVRNNDSVTIDWMIAKNNAGWALDLPLTSLGDGRPNIEINQPVTLPLNVIAAEETVLGYTIAMHEFKYLPTVAE